MAAAAAFRPGADPLLNFAEALARCLADFGRVEAHGVIRDRLFDAWSKAERASGDLTPAGRTSLEVSDARGRRSATAVRANVAETSRSAPAGRAGAVAPIARARGAIIGASDCDREHLFPIPNRPSRRAFTMPHARGARQ
jgi:hypothetical protein